MNSNSLANLKKGKDAPRCSYIRLNDQRCSQPALQDRAFCRFHDLVEHPLPDSRLIPFVEDASTLQLALMQVIRGLQRGEITRPVAGTILYALQIAASNLKHFSEEVGHPFAQPVRKTRKEEEDEEALEGPSLAEILLERLQLLEDEGVLEKAGAPPAPTSPAVKPPGQPVTESRHAGIVDKLEACCRRPATPLRTLAAWR